MKKLLLAMLLTMVGTSAMAEWQLVDFSNDGINYFENKSIRKNGSEATMWDLIDYVKPATEAGLTFTSKKSKYVYNCKNESRKILSIALFDGNMGRGKVVYTYDWAKGESTYSAIAPDTIGETLMKAACKLN